jgi:uncharacterized protein YhaN
VTNNIIERIKETLADESPTVAIVQELIDQATSDLTLLNVQADAAHQRMLDLNNESPDEDRVARDKLRGEAERLAAAIETLKSKTLPDAEQREQEAARQEAYDKVKAALADAERQMSRVLPQWTQVLRNCVNASKAVAEVNKQLPKDAPKLEVPESIADEVIISTDQAIMWSQFWNGVVTPFDEPVDELPSRSAATLRPRAAGLLERRAFNRIKYTKRGDPNTYTRYEFLPDVTVEVEPPRIKSGPSGLKRSAATILVNGQAREIPM